MKGTWVKLAFRACLGLGLGAALGAAARAERPAVVPAYSSPAPAMMAADETRPSTTQRPSTDQVPSNAAPTPDQSSQQPQADMNNATSAPSGDAGAGATGGEGSEGAAMLGRVDFANRFNLFDTQSACPMNRIWFSFEYANTLNTGVTPFHNFTSSSTLGLISSGGITSATLSSGLVGQQLSALANAVGFIHQTNELMYRVGVEYAISPCLSVAVQGGYESQANDPLFNGPSSGFTNPEVMVKYALVREQGTCVSATFGMNIDIDPGQRDIAENNWRFLPGILAYQELGDKAFVQAGTQLGLATGHNPYTFDWALSTGYWLVGSPHQENCNCGHGKVITGIVPQLEIFGAHVIANREVLDLFQTGSIANIGVEPRHTIDITVGGTVFLLDNKMWIGSGYSFPITGGDVRDAEFIATVGLRF